MKNKEEALKLLKQKNNGEIKLTYNEISLKTGYEKRQLIRLSKEIEKRDIESILVHGNTNKPPAITASDQEIDYIKNFKSKYPSISISQFMDIYHEDIIFNPKMKKDVKSYELKLHHINYNIFYINDTI